MNEKQKALKTTDERKTRQRKKADEQKRITKETDKHQKSDA